MQKPKFISTFYGSRPAFSAPSRNVRRLPLVCFVRFVNPLIGFLRTIYPRSPHPRLVSARADTHVSSITYATCSRPRVPSVCRLRPSSTFGLAAPPVAVDDKTSRETWPSVFRLSKISPKTCFCRHDFPAPGRPWRLLGRH